MKSLFKLTVAYIIFSHASADLDVDVNDVPAACQSICRPMMELSRICDVNDDFLGENEALEFNNERGCFCSNQSFNVAQMTGLCQSCVQQSTVAGQGGKTRGMSTSLYLASQYRNTNLFPTRN